MPSQKALMKAGRAFERVLKEQGPDAAQAALDRRGGKLPSEMKTRAQGMINEVRMNSGGYVKANIGGYMMPMNQWGGPLTAAQQMAMKKAQGGGQPMMPGAPQGGGGNMVKQIGGMVAKKALTSMLGPLGSLLPFNNGGAVSGNPMSPDTFINGKIKSVHFPTPAPAQNRNMGGPISKNPHGYNEGGAVMETPIKKVMDEQKLEQQAKAFELEQKRKQQAHDMAMQQKQQQFALSQKLKKESATTNKQPTKPKGPLG